MFLIGSTIAIFIVLCFNLKSQKVKDYINNNAETFTDASYLFSYCPNLTTLPEDLFNKSGIYENSQNLRSLGIYLPLYSSTYNQFMEVEVVATKKEYDPNKYYNKNVF